MTLSETWLNSNISDNIISIPGYNIFRLDRQTLNPVTNKIKLKVGGGTAIYVKEKYECDAFTLNDFNVSNSDIEMLWIAIKTQHLKPLMITSIYRPPSGNTNNFIETLNKSLESITDLFDNEIFILGDMKIDMLNTKDKKCFPF